MNRLEAVGHHLAVQPALAHLADARDEAVSAAVAVQQIPAPTFAEAGRAAYVLAQFQDLGLADVGRDALHNVFGRLPGTGGAPPVVISAHLDTVFPVGTPLDVRYDGGLVYGPGLADNALGVAGLLVLARTLRAFHLRPPADIWLVANVCEEGLGDLRGMKAVADRFGSQVTYLVLEGGCFGRIFHRGIGVRRFQIDVTAPGGHSWGNFGSPSAIHLLGQIVAAIAGLRVPASPKTTYNVGLIEGGTSINTIAQSARLHLDLRSEAPAALGDLVGQVEELVARAGDRPDVIFTMTQIGDRPPGELPADSELVRLAVAALRYVGCEQIELAAGSTDANVPLSRDVAAVCIGLARSGNTHRADEYLDPASLPGGLSQLLLLALAVAGF